MQGAPRPIDLCSLSALDGQGHQGRVIVYATCCIGWGFFADVLKGAFAHRVTCHDVTSQYRH